MPGIAAATISLLLGACASTPQSLTSDPGNRRVARVAAPYQVAFKRVVEASRECFAPPLFGRTSADATVYPELKQGTLVLGGGTIGAQIVVEVSEATPGTSEVVVYAKRPDAHLARIERWAGGDPRCDA
jgi:hypothetical protein